MIKAHSKSLFGWFIAVEVGDFLLLKRYGESALFFSCPSPHGEIHLGVDQSRFSRRRGGNTVATSKFYHSWPGQSLTTSIRTQHFTCVKSSAVLSVLMVVYYIVPLKWRSTAPFQLLNSNSCTNFRSSTPIEKALRYFNPFVNQTSRVFND